MNNNVFETSNIELSFWSGEPLSRAPFLQNFSFFLRYRRFPAIPPLGSHGFGVTTENVIWQKMNFHQKQKFFHKEDPHFSPADIGVSLQTLILLELDKTTTERKKISVL